MNKTIFSILLISLIFNAKINAQESLEMTEELNKEFIDEHNQWRKDVGTAPLEWSDELAQYASEWGMELGKKCDMKHRPHSGKWKQIHGENIFWTSAPQVTPKYVVDSWGSEIKYYKKPKPIDDDFVKYGHYTQVVWKDTKKVGCAIIECKGNKGIIVICNYDPSGNWDGETAY